VLVLLLPALAAAQNDVFVSDQVAQPDDNADSALQPEGATAQDDPPLREIPDTVIEARPFPSNPLGDQTVITPSRTETSAGENASSVTVITQEQITATRANSVLEVLRGTVGLDVVQSGGPGRPTSVFMRGANSEHTKVLLDGIPLNDPSGATRAFDFSVLSVDNIERIEVVRGPQSTVYGSDAIGGVINIITKRGDGPLSITATGMGGSFGTHQERISLSGGDDRAYYSFGASYLDTDGITVFARRLGGLEADGYQNATFSGRFGWTPNDAFNVDYVVRYTDADSDIDGFMVDTLNRELRQKQFFQRVQIQSLLLDGDLEQTVGFNLVDYNRLDTLPGLFDTPEFNGQTRSVDWQANYRVTDSNVVTAGVDYTQEEFSNTFLAQQPQNLTGVYVQDRFSLRDISFTTVGVRWDDHSTAGDANTFRVTQLFRIAATGTDIHGSLGRGFRAPALAQKFGFVGNPALRPEFSKGWDAGVRQSFLNGDLTLDATYFRNDFVDLIVFDPTIPGPGGFGGLNNVARARAAGVELTASWNIDCATSASLSWTYDDPIDTTTGAQLLRRPHDKVSFSIHRSFFCDQAALNLYFLYVGPRRDFGTVAVTTLPRYVTVNLSGNYQVNDTWQLFFRAENLLDEDYEEVFGFETPGVSGYFGANLSW
jgi:vitamin B12 transporter